MCIDLFSIGPLTVHSYGLMIGIGFLLAVLLGSHAAKRRGMDPDAVLSIGLLAIVVGFLGGKLLYCIVEWRSFLADPLSTLGTSGFVVYGGIVTGCLAVFLYCRKKRLDTLSYFDLLLPFVAMAQGFGRIGCFMAGCCYGKATDSFLGVIFPESGLAPAGIPILPTQLFSAAGDFLLFAVLLLLSRKLKTKGHVFSFYLTLYSIGRFIIEFFRQDPRGSIGIFSTSQFVSILTLLLGVASFPLFSALAKKKSAAKATDSEEAAGSGIPDDTVKNVPAEGSADPDTNETGSAGQPADDNT